MEAALSNDTSFGPQLGQQFDFTLSFEQAIFVILPSALFLVISAGYVSRRIKRPAVVRPGLLLWLKLVSSKNLVIVTYVIHI